MFASSLRIGAPVGLGATSGGAVAVSAQGGSQGPANSWTGAAGQIVKIHKREDLGLMVTV